MNAEELRKIIVKREIRRCVKDYLKSYVDREDMREHFIEAFSLDLCEIFEQFYYKK